MSRVHEPISRLSLELFDLGELSVDKAERIEAHLAQCPPCRHALDFIEQDARPLPPLRTRSVPAKTRRGLFAGWRFAYAWAAAAAAVFLGLVFTLTVPDWKSPDRNQDAVPQVKGRDTSLYIVRNRSGLSTENPNAFQEGDTFKVFVTHLSGHKAPWDLAVFQGDKVYFPLTPEAPLVPGARVPLPDAFLLDGNEPVVICVFIGEVPTRTELRAEKQALVAKAAACKTLQPTIAQQ